MKRPTTASLKKVTAENLAALGVDRLAAILVGVADARPELKRRLRMELAAEQGAEHLAPEIDKRLASLETSRGRVSWRQRPSFVRDLDGLRGLVVDRLAPLDTMAAISRLLVMLSVAHRVESRMRDKDGALAEVFEQAAADLGRLLGEDDSDKAAERVVDAFVHMPVAWSRWLPIVLDTATPAFATAALRRLSGRTGQSASWGPLIRALADDAGDASAYQATFTHKELLDPSAAAEVARRLLSSGRVVEARALLNASRPSPKGGRLLSGCAKTDPLDFDWETAWIEVLDRSGQADEAQAARWSSFERTLSADRLRDFTRGLADFEDVEAEGRAFAHAAGHADLEAALRFLVTWPALPEAAQLITARGHDLTVSAEDAEAWAAKLRARQPAAAELLLRKAAAAAFGRREFATCDRLTAEADAIRR